MVGPSGAVLGIDRTVAAVNAARRRVAALEIKHITFAVAELESFIADGPFDALIGRFLLMYLPDPAATLRLLFRSLNSGAVIAFLEMEMRSAREVSDRLHPVVQLAAAGLLIWFVVAAWLLFGGGGYVNLALVMISVLVFMALAIPWVLWRAGVAARRRNAEPGDAGETPSETLATWLQGRFATADAERPSTAAVEILLPLAAVAFGLTALGIVFQLTRAGVV
jgi:SAM-dependent methyltransferase